MIELPIEKAFTLIEPGPVLLLTTHDKGKSNIMTITWHMVVDFTPRIAITTGPWNFSYHALLNTKECTLCVPTIDLAQKTVQIGDCSGETIDKFKQFELTQLPASDVKAPLISECIANLECRVIDYVKPHGIFILQAVRAWIDPDKKDCRTFHAVGDGTFVGDGETIDLRHLMEDKIPFGV